MKFPRLLDPTTPVWNGTFQLLHHWEYPGQSSKNVLPMIDMDPTSELCIYLSLRVVADQAKKYGVTFDQPLWMKAQQYFFNFIFYIKLVVK